MKKFTSLIRDTFRYYKKGILIAGGLYFASLLFGLVFFQKEELTIHPKALGFLELLSHNGLSAVLIIATGLISFGLLGNFVLLANGAILGRVLVGVYNNYGMSPILNNVAPHFAFETLALLIATAISYESNKFYYNMRHEERRVIRLKYVTVGLLTIFALLSLAAIIESHLGR